MTKALCLSYSSGNLSLLGTYRRGRSMTLTEQLQTVVEDYFTRYPHMSVNSLALKSGVGATTLRRLLSGSIKGVPAPHTILNIASAVSNEKRLSVLINMFEGELGEVLEESFGPYIENKINHTYSPDLNEELKDEIKYFIYKMSANRAGVTWAWVADTFGKIGLDKLKKMNEAGLLKGDQKEGLYHAKEKNFSLNVKTASKHLARLTSFYKPEQVGVGKNLFYSLSESLNEEGIQKVKEIEKEAIQKIYQVMINEKYEGETPYFSLVLSDTMTIETEEEGVLQ